MHAFWTAFGLIFIAEMGDKTQFMTLAMSAKYSPALVMTGVLTGTILISLLSVFLGQTVGHLLPYFWINLLAGIAFIAFGLFSLAAKSEIEAESEEAKLTIQNSSGSALKEKLQAVIAIASAFFIAELGDKTMLATVAIAGREYHYFWQVWIGSSLGLVAANALAIVAGKALAGKLSSKTLKYIIAAVYCVSGLLAIIEAFRHTG